MARYAFYRLKKIDENILLFQNVPLGILRLLLQILVVSFVVIYQLWYARGYQEFAEVEASVTTKVKGFSRFVHFKLLIWLYKFLTNKFFPKLVKRALSQKHIFPKSFGAIGLVSQK